MPRASPTLVRLDLFPNSFLMFGGGNFSTGLTNIHAFSDMWILNFEEEKIKIDVISPVDQYSTRMATIQYGSGSSTGAIVGGVLGAVVALILAGIGIFMFVRYQNKYLAKQEQKEKGSTCK